MSEPLLGGRAAGARSPRWLIVTIFALVVAALVLPGLIASKQQPRSIKPKKRVIMMVSDGMGPSSLSLARSFAELTGNLEKDSQQLFLDQHLLGTSRTRSSNSLITDSAAGATAFSCALHSYNTAIGVDDKGVPCGTVLEAAKAKGLATGLVVTSDITDATPASFSAHVRTRASENIIAQQQIGYNPLNRTVDLLLGGGYCHYLPAGTPESCRTDDRDLFKEARANGFHAFSDRKSFDDFSEADLPVLGLFASFNMDYTIDRDPKKQPSLAEMTRKALDALEAHADEGFFLMVEGSRIDMASHANDPAAHAHDIMAYNDAFRTVSDWLDAHEGGGTLIATSDHETGGVATGLQIGPEYPVYAWYPEILLRAKHSAEYLAVKLSRSHLTGPKLRRYIEREILARGLGIRDAADAEIEAIEQPHLVGNVQAASWAISKVLSTRARIGYSTHGHTAADVLIFGHGRGVDEMRGNHENIEIGQFLMRALDVTLDGVTLKLNAGEDKSWYDAGVAAPPHP